MDAPYKLSTYICFSIMQASLGSPLEFQPPSGSVELDALINCYVVGNGHIQQKRAQVSLEFLNDVDETEFLYGPVIRFYQIMPEFDWGFPILGQSCVETLSEIHDDGRLRMSSRSHKTRRSRDGSLTSVREAGQRRLPGFSIMTKEGVDITECVSRGPKTKEQRDHAALMRRLRACASCKRRKQRCDPSHHEKDSSPGSTSSQDTSTRCQASRHKSTSGSSSGSSVSMSPCSHFDAKEAVIPNREGVSMSGRCHNFSPATSWKPLSSLISSHSRSSEAGAHAHSLLNQRRQALLYHTEAALAGFNRLHSSCYTPTSTDQSFSSSSRGLGNNCPSLSQSDVPSVVSGIPPGLGYAERIIGSSALQQLHSEPLTCVEGVLLASQRSRFILSEQTDRNIRLVSDCRTIDPRRIMRHDNTALLAKQAVDPAIAISSITVTLTCTGDSPYDHNYRIASDCRHSAKTLPGCSQSCVDALRCVYKSLTEAFSSPGTNQDPLSQTIEVAKPQVPNPSMRRTKNTIGKVKLHSIDDHVLPATQPWQLGCPAPSVVQVSQHIDSALALFCTVLGAGRRAWTKFLSLSTQNGSSTPILLC